MAEETLDEVEHYEIAERNLRIAEALLFASAEPLSSGDLATYLSEGADVPALMAVLEERYAGRGVTLVRRGDKWAFRTAEDLGFLLRREEQETRALSRAALETLRTSGTISVEAVEDAFADAGIAGIQTIGDERAVAFGAAAPEGGCIFGEVSADVLTVEIGGIIMDGGCLPAVGH